MKKVYILEDLDCAHCAALIEEEVGKLEGVSKSSLAFLTQKLTIEVAEDKVAAVEKAIIEIVKKREPDVTVIAKQYEQEVKKRIKETWYQRRIVCRWYDFRTYTGVVSFGICC